jgi:hypothetical protein
MLGVMGGLIIWMAAGAGMVFAAQSNEGLLAVTPVSGRGVTLVKANGSGERRVCPSSGGCYVTGAARFSPDGRSLIVEGLTGIDLMYVNGACDVCQVVGLRSPSTHPAFAPDGTEITFTYGGKVLETGIDGVEKANLATGSYTDGVLSSTNELAAVGHGKVWVGKPGGLHSIGLGSNPSWAPKGNELAYSDDGSVTLWSNGRTRRLAAGSAPAFSPDGGSIAYIGPGHKVEIVATNGGTPHAVGHVTGTAVTWQPTAAGPATCAVPPGSTVIASNGQGIVTKDDGHIVGDPGPSEAYMGCLSSTGQPWLLEDLWGSGVLGGDLSGGNAGDAVSQTAISGNYAALVAGIVPEKGYAGPSDTVDLFNLSTGQDLTTPANRIGCTFANEQVCGTTMPDIDQIALAANGTFAVNGVLRSDCSTTPDVETYCWADAIVEDTGQGVNILDQVPQPTLFQSTPEPLSDMTLTGTTLSWQHNGNPMSADLG